MYKYQKISFFLLFCLIANFKITGQVGDDYKPIPVIKVFHNLGNNLGGSFTFNYGLNQVVSIAGSYGMVKSGIDWKWYKLSLNNEAIPKAGLPSVILGGTLPFIVPGVLYIHGRNRENRDLQIAGLALLQAELISVTITSAFKAITGRVPPEILGEKNKDKEDFSGKFRFGFNRGGIFHGWPSGHTMTAFAMATTLTTLYPDNTAIKIGAMSYAYFIGIGISTNIHWLSDAFAGALMGYAIGKTVGKSFRSLMNSDYSNPKTSMYFGPNQIGVLVKF
jgi:membrane-associated phospholipid phosphatase